ncbi:MAG: YabP/YqfC family sporulation protein [Oscillospiraceae bacterium]|jgi:sporulation protein YqfC
MMKGSGDMRRNSKKSAGKKLIAETLQMPFDTLSSGITQIELLGNSEAVVEGCKGILEYDDNIIRIAIHKMEVKFSGIDLSIKSLNSESIIIEGQISGIEFLT